MMMVQLVEAIVNGLLRRRTIPQLETMEMEMD
jgi:hypothetical protein